MHMVDIVTHILPKSIQYIILMFKMIISMEL